MSRIESRRELEKYARLCGLDEPTLREVSDQYGRSAISESAEACLTALGYIPETIEKHRAAGIPEDITLATVSDLAIWCGTHYEKSGRRGLSPEQLPWLRLQADLKLVRIGRLQYVTTPFFGGKILVFRSRETGEERILCEDGLPFDSRGQRSEEETGTAFRSVLRSDESSWTGNPVSGGRALPEVVKLARSEWEKVLEYGSPLAAVHIPADGPLAEEACSESLKRAVRFFRKHPPERNPIGFWCHSWLLDPRLSEVLPEKSNILDFQNLGTLYPVGGESDITTRLRPGTALAAAVEAGISRDGGFHNGGWFRLAESGGFDGGRD